MVSPPTDLSQMNDSTGSACPITTAIFIGCRTGVKYFPVREIGKNAGFPAFWRKCLAEIRKSSGKCGINLPPAGS
jgi:hypothetical protein